MPVKNEKERGKGNWDKNKTQKIKIHVSKLFFEKYQKGENNRQQDEKTCRGLSKPPPLTMDQGPVMARAPIVGLLHRAEIDRPNSEPPPL